MEDDTNKRNAPDSLAPIQVERLSAEDEAALTGMGGNKIWSLLSVLGIAAVVLLGGTAWMQEVDAKKQFSDTGEAVAELGETGFDAFAHCAFPGMPVSQFLDDHALHSAFERFSERFRSGYARKLRKCNRSLERLGKGLGELSAPPELDESLSGMQEATEQLIAATAGYADYLETGDGYDVATATPRLDDITLAWRAYEAEQLELSRLIRKHGN